MSPLVAEKGQESIGGTLWVDPGGVSGVCVAYYSLGAPRGASWEAVVDWEAVNVRGSDNQQLDEIWGLYEEMVGEVEKRNPAFGGRKEVVVVTVGCEDFVVRQFNASRDFLKPVRITAALERLWYEEGLGEPGAPGSQVYRQSPGDAMSAVTNERLRAWGFWTKGRDGEDHARDATRHMLLHLRKMAQSNGAVH